MDLISRQATIDAIEQHKTAVLEGREWDEGIAYGYAAAHRHLVEIVKQLPSAERRGSWVGIDDEPCDVWECDRCGHIVERECPPRFCEECGARMEATE